MKLKIQKWGNGAAVRLPASLLTQMGVKVGDLLNADISVNTVVLSLAKPKYRLADLMAEMADGLPDIDGWNEAPVRGKEIP